MNFDKLFKAFDALIAVRDAAKDIKGGEPTRDTAMTQPTPPGLAGQIEAGLTNVVLAALKEAFDRDHARLEMERAHVEEQRRRAEETMRMELRRQAADRELGRLRLLAGTALVGWIVSVALVIARIGEMSVASQALLAAGCLLLLATLGSAFHAQGQVGGTVAEHDRPPDVSPPGTIALWLLIGGLALSAASLLV
jgi:hypothetical protein